MLLNSGITCREFKIVNIQANTTVSSFTARIPTIQVTPSSGKRNTAAFTKCLFIKTVTLTKDDIEWLLLHCVSIFAECILLTCKQNFESNYQKQTIYLQN